MCYYWDCIGHLIMFENILYKNNSCSFLITKGLTTNSFSKKKKIGLF